MSHGKRSQGTPDAVDDSVLYTAHSSVTRCGMTGGAAEGQDHIDQLSSLIVTQHSK